MTIGGCTCRNWNCPHCAVQYGKIETVHSMGWECPKCRNIYSPQTAQCNRCNTYPSAATVAYIVTGNTWGGKNDR